MKRTASTASLSPSTSTSTSTSSSPSDAENRERTTKRGSSRMQLEALAQVAMREGLSEEQVAYEKWVDGQPLGDVVAWEEMGEGERGVWCREVLGRGYGRNRGGGECGGEGEERGMEMGGGCGCGEGVGIEVEDGYERIEDRGEEGGKEAVGDLGESRWIAVRTEHAVKETLASEIQRVGELEECPLTSAAEAESCPAEETSPFTESTTIEEASPKSEPQRQFRHSARVWTATTTEESSLKNKPQCPPCARLKRTWTRCRGGPPCIECQHRGLSAEQCQSYDLLNRSRKNRLKKRGEKMEEVCGETEIEEIGRKESVVEDVMKEEGKGDTGGLGVSGERGDSDAEEEAQ